MSRHFLLSTVLALVLAGPAFARNHSARDLSVEPTTASHRVGSLSADAWFDRAAAVYAPGETVRIFARTNQDAYVTALSIGPTGHVTQLFPNAFHPDNFVRADTPIEIPGFGARAVVAGALGAEIVKIVVSHLPVEVIPDSQLSAATPFRSVIGGADALVRDLDVVAVPTSADQEIVVVDKVFQSGFASYSAPGDAGTVIVVPDDAPAPFTAPFYPLPSLSPSAALERQDRLASGPFPAAGDRDMVSHGFGVGQARELGAVRPASVTVAG